jgi:hypothetical protein
MRIVKEQDSPIAAEELRRCADNEAMVFARTRTDCPENGGLGCHGDDGREGGKCPHGWLTAAETLRRAAA